MKKIILCFAIIFTTIYFSSCSSVTEINGTWKKPATAAQKYNKIIVIGLFKDIVKRSKIENSIVTNLTLNGINAVASVNALPNTLIDTDSDNKMDAGAKEVIVAKLKEIGADGAFTCAVEDVKKSTNYVPGTAYYNPGMGMYPFYGYYGSAFNTVYSPGYYTTTTNYIFTSNFYNVASEQLLWSAQSSTFDPASLNDFATSYGKAVVSQFLSAGVITK